jgi:hypothetical protein
MYHRWPQLWHLWGLILRPQGHISTPLPLNHPTWCENIMECILLTPYLTLNITQTLIAIFHILLKFVQMEKIKLIFKVLSLTYKIKYIFLPKMYIDLKFFFMNFVKLNYISMMIRWKCFFKHVMYNWKIFYD